MARSSATGRRGWRTGPPLAGVMAGLLAAGDAQWLVVAPLRYAVPAARPGRAPGRRGAGDGVPLAYASADGVRHPACMALRVSLLPALREYLASGERRVGLWQSRLGAAEARFDGTPEAFMNVNTPEELERAERYASQ